ncbi:hypothetical protein [Indioceanicola profundi]|uniref:hypothetical protein n=1 Tax=Indioceanicola profundi TaxID=2220096 RepID=UPI0013C49E4C|nr:hypothetical protein [Indioceanicola profundi]
MTDTSRHSPEEHQPDSTGRLPRRVAERLTLGLAALVLALFGGFGLTAEVGESRSEGLRGRAQAEAPASERAVAGILRTERRNPDNVTPAGGPDALPEPETAALRPVVFASAAPIPASTSAPARPAHRSPRVPTGPPAFMSA